jgi:hypothetical protein
MKLGAEPNLLEPVPARPKRMTHARYFRLLAALLDAEERVFATVKIPGSVGTNVGSVNRK